MVSGSVAAIFYGETRMTNNVDIIVHLPAADAPKLEAAFPGGSFIRDYQLDREWQQVLALAE